LHLKNVNPASSCKKKSTLRHIPDKPERILDAPDILDDYYLNPLDWGANGLLAVALKNQLYLWNAVSGDIRLLVELTGQDYLCSVQFSTDAPDYLALGLSNGEIHLYDVARQQRLRNMTGHGSRVGALGWNQHLLTSGSRTGHLHHHDVRVAQHLISRLHPHSQEICGIRWAPDGRFMATGANDNLLLIWPTGTSATAPVYTLSEHQAAVKALAWCPWQNSLLATGGGTADRRIRFWNVNTGTCVQSVDTQSQVCSILWSKDYRELISAHGYPKFQLAIWKYPEMALITELEGHSARILHMVMSPCGQMVMSASADESLRLWNCFAVDPAAKKQDGKLFKNNSKPGILGRTMIR